jgi:hypothetical protein
MDDRTAELLAQAAISDAAVEYERLCEAVMAHPTGAGFVAELVEASQSDPRAFVRALNDRTVHARARELGVVVPTYATLPLPKGNR